MLIAKSILFVLVLVALAYSVYSAFKYTRMISNIFLSLVYNPILEEQIAARGEKTIILDSADREIETLLFQSQSSKKVLIFCHESGATKESWEKYAYFLPDFGWNILSVELKKQTGDAEANSLLQWPMEEDVEKLLTVIRWSHRAFGLDAEIVLFGVSNGADIALATSLRDSSVKAVIADGLFSMKEIFRDYIRKWAPILVRPNLFGENYPDWVVNIFTNLGFWFSQKKSGKKFIDIEKILHRRHAPLLMIHGEKDDYVPGTHQKFLQNIVSDKEGSACWVAPKARHNEAVVLSRVDYERRIMQFLSGIK